MEVYAIVFDGEPVAVFSTQEKADLFLEALREGEVIPLTVDPISTELLETKSAYRVQLDEDGDIKAGAAGGGYGLLRAMNGECGTDQYTRGRWIGYVFAADAVDAIITAKSLKERNQDEPQKHQV
jgi:hypothetical protein